MPRVRQTTKPVTLPADLSVSSVFSSAAAAAFFHANVQHAWWENKKRTAESCKD